MGKYKLMKTIGKGNFAKVKLARHMPTGQEVCVCGERERERERERESHFLMCPHHAFRSIIISQIWIGAGFTYPIHFVPVNTIRNVKYMYNNGIIMYRADDVQISCSVCMCVSTQRVGEKQGAFIQFMSLMHLTEGIILSFRPCN